MKLLILIALIFAQLQVLSAAGCAAGNYCQSCTTATGKCETGYNYVGLKLKPKMCNTTVDCKTDRTVAQTVLDCQVYYVKDNASALVKSALSGNNSCLVCKTAKNILAVELTAYTAKCVSTGAALEYCTSWTSVVNNCDTYVCPTDAKANKVAKQCNFCKTGHFLSVDVTKSLLNLYGSLECTVEGASPIIANCSRYIGGKGLTSVTAQVNNCYECKTGNAVQADAKKCLAFTKDANCRQLDAAGTGCQVCKDNYHFSNVTCVLSSNLIGLAFVALAALFFA